MARRLIDADKLIEKAIKEKRFVFFRHDIPTDETIIKTVYKDLADFIQSAPTVDAVEVVRCKDCFAWKEHDLEGFPVGKGYCKVNMMDTDGYFYCGYADGERKEK